MGQGSQSEQNESLENDYREQRSIIKIAEKYGCSHEAVAYQLAKRGIKAFDKKIHIENVDCLYEKHKNLKKVAELMGCSTTTVKERLLEKGFDLSHDNKDLSLEVGLGRYGERMALYLLKGSKDMNKQNVLSPYDIEWNGRKIDVKVSKPRKRERGQDYYSFSIRKHNCDYLLLIALDVKNYPRRLFFIKAGVKLHLRLVFMEKGTSYPEKANVLESTYMKYGNVYEGYCFAIKLIIKVNILILDNKHKICYSICKKKITNYNILKWIN